MLKEFKEFINRGNVIDLAVAFVLGFAFAGVVASFVSDLLLAVVGAIVGQQGEGFSFLNFTMNGVTIGLGNFLNTIVNFLLVAFGVFLVVKMVNRFRAPAPTPAPGPTEIELLTEIRDALRTR